jgi:hypothetical protein
MSGTRQSREPSVGEQGKLAEATKLRQEAERLEREARVDLQRPTKHQPLPDMILRPTPSPSEIAKRLFNEDGPGKDPVSDAINANPPQEHLRRGKRRHRG